MPYATRELSTKSGQDHHRFFKNRYQLW